jgi:tripartite-type tricarboxylate transporter receptor subunit TctC
MVAPAKLPRAILARLGDETARPLTTPQQRERVANLGGDEVASTPAEFDKFIRAEIERYGKVTRAAGISAD